MMVIKRISPMSAGKIQAVIGVVVGLIAGLLMFAFGSLMGSLLSSGAAGAGYGAAAVPRGGIMALGGFAIIVAPITYGIIGFLGGVIGAAIYNVVAKWVGGIELDLEQKA